MFDFKALAATALATLAIGAAVLPASADYPGAHPYYRHALADLRYARSLIARPAYAPGADANEDVALDDIGHAYRAIRAAGFDDGKSVNDPTPVDGGLDHRGRLNRALQALGDAHRDISREEQNPDARGAQRFGIREIDGAIGAIRRARFDVRTGF